MTPNRITVAAGGAGAIVSAIVALLGAVPDAWKGPVLIAALVCASSLAALFVHGGQKHEARQAGKPTWVPLTTELAPVVGLTTGVAGTPRIEFQAPDPTDEQEDASPAPAPDTRVTPDNPDEEPSP